MKIKSGNTAKNTLHKKEVLLLVLVLTGALVAVVYMMVYTPLQEERAELEDQVQTLDAELNTKLLRAQQLPDLQEQLRRESQSDAELYNLFYGMVDQEEFIFMLHRHAQDSGIQLERVTFERNKADLSNNASEQLKPEEQEEQASDGDADTGEEVGGDTSSIDELNKRWEAVDAYFNTLKMTTISLDITGEYEQCMQFLSLLQINDKKIAVTDVLLERTQKEDAASETEEQPAELEGTTPTTPMRGVLSLMIYHVPEADMVHPARTERKESGGDWIVGADDPFDAAVIAPKQTQPPSQ